MKYKAVIFDLDGTLLDTLEDIANSVNRVLRRWDSPEHSIEAYRYFIGDGVEELAARVLPDGQRNPTTVAQVVAAIREEYGQHWADKTHPYEGIPDLLDALTVCGIRLAVLSNKPDGMTRLTVSRLLSKWQFDLVIGAGPSVPRKPDPSAALEIAGRLSIPPGEILYVGDGDTDMKTAGAAGMYAVGALWGFRSAEELSASGAKVLIEKPLDLLRLL